MTTPFLVTVPVKTISEANTREHWGAKYKRANRQKWAVYAALRPFQKHLRKLNGSLTVTITRIGPRRLDTDNLARSQKAVRDQIAYIIGTDDGSSRYDWRYVQEKGRPREYAIRIEIREGNDAKHD